MLVGAEQAPRCTGEPPRLPPHNVGGPGINVLPTLQARLQGPTGVARRVLWLEALTGPPLSRHRLLLSGGAASAPPPRRSYVQSWGLLVPPMPLVCPRMGALVPLI